jgi:hypothetical protein
MINGDEHGLIARGSLGDEMKMRIKMMMKKGGAGFWD